MSDKKPPQDDGTVSDEGQEGKKVQPDAKRECVKTYIGTVVKGKKAAERFNDLLAKTLKLQP